MRGKGPNRRLAAPIMASLVIALAVAAMPARAMARTFGTVSIAFGSKYEPIVNEPESVTVSGTIATGGALRVYTFAGAKKCPPQEGEEGAAPAGLGTPNVASVPLSAGAFSATYSVSFASAGEVAVCAYVTDALPEGGSQPDVYAEATLEVQPPTPHLTGLKVTTRSHAGNTALAPGRTDLVVHAAGGGDLRLTLRRAGRRRVEDLGYKSAGTFVVPWSCSQPGGVYAYTVTATDEYGKTLTRSGRFRAVSAARCRALRIADERRRPQEERERREREAAYGREEEQLQREVAQVEHDQRVACEQGLGGRVERVNESIAIPPVPKDTATECEVEGRIVELQGDPPKVVSERP